MCHVCMRYELEVINVGGFNIDDLEPDRQSAKFNSTPNFLAIRYYYGKEHSTSSAVVSVK